MRTEVMEFYGLARAPRGVGYYETKHHRELLQDIKHAVYNDPLVALSGVVGSGKTFMLQRLQTMLVKEGKVLVSRSVSVDTGRTTLGTLITALFCDLTTGKKKPEIPKYSELRERRLLELVAKRKLPIVLIVDEAHDLRRTTLTELKRLTEMIAGGGGRLSVLLAGHPKLRNDLLGPEMEEVGSRTTIFPLEGVTGSQREYIAWLITSCAREKLKVESVLEPAALDLLAARLRTPLQIEQHLTLALETGYQASMKPITEAVIEDVLSKRIDDLGPTLIRHGYSTKVLCELLGVRPAEIKALLRQTLEPDRAQELKDQMLAAGLPV